MDLSITSFLLIVVAAMDAPLVTAAVGRVVPFPLVVVELLLGVLIGPQVLGLAEVDELASFFGSLGLAFLFLFAGYEIEFDRIRGAPLRLALIGWDCRSCSPTASPASCTRPASSSRAC